MAEKEEGALSRWSRLKRGQEAEGGVEAVERDRQQAMRPGDQAAALAPEAGSQPGVAHGGEAGDETPGIREEDLPDIDSLTYDSDFTAFMQKGVPLALRNRALAMLWKSSPLLANVDGLNDYDLDYTIKEFELIASESAEDLRTGKKRESAHERRRAERDEQREIRRNKTARRPRDVEQDGDAEERDDHEREPEKIAAAGQSREAGG